MKNFTFLRSITTVWILFAFYSCQKESISKTVSHFLPKVGTSIQGEVNNRNGMLYFGCADDFIDIDDQLIKAERESQDTTLDEPVLESFEDAFKFYSLRKKVRDEASLFETEEALLNLSEEELDNREMYYPDESEVIQDPFLRTYLNPLREVFIGESYFRFFSPLDVIEIINPDPILISMVRGTNQLNDLPLEVKNNPFTIIHDLRYRGEPEIRVRELEDGKALLIAPIPSACQIQWEIDGESVFEGEPYVIVQENVHSTIKVRVIVKNEVIEKRTTTSAGICDVYQEEISITGLSVSLGENCGEVFVEYNLGSFSTAPVQYAAIDFGDGVVHEIDPNSSNNLVKHTYIDGQPRKIKLSIFRGTSPSNIVCSAFDENEIEPNVSDCCMTTGNTSWTWKKNGKYKMRYKYIIGKTLIRKRTKYIVKGRYKKGAIRRKGTFNSQIKGDALIELGHITCGDLLDFNKDPGDLTKRWYTQKEKSPFEDGIVIRYNHYEESMAFKLKVRGHGGSVGEQTKYLPKN